MLRLLCVTAHPDDEAGGFGGTLLRCARRGVETHVICMTAGHAATHRGGAKSDDELKQIRRREFATACRLLQVKHAVALDYPDGKLDQQDFYATVTDLTRRVREIRPQVMMTFGSEGAITAHPDHSMVSIFATMAFHWAGRSNRIAGQLHAGLTPHVTQKLYHSTTLFTMPDRQPISQAPASTVLELVQDEIDAKIAAFKCHTSQAPLFSFFEETMRRRGNMEMFHLAARSTPMKAEMEQDLFAGVQEDPTTEVRKHSAT
ncbi:MAG TPA: PIG-L family deacetylase [Candidatus Saccharimonadales bacterium]|jgi:LmbE family N-acetylglucosaminyl deacetylase|nr:PIG-L family deacetylase [Candidatus Saccharimonadales bacterium]